MMKQLLPHVLVISFPAQGHVMPLMEVSNKLVDHGVKVTFVNTESIHNKLVAGFSSNEPDGEYDHNRLRLVSIPDGLEKGNEEASGKLLEDLIRKINENEGEDEKVSCVIADLATWWALEVAEKLGLKRAMFSTTSVAVVAMSLHIPKLIEDGIIDEEGTPFEEEMIQLSPTMHAIHIDEFIWNCTDDPNMRKVIFGFSSITNKAAKRANWILCNSFLELEPAACDLVPNILPIGPLVASTNRVDQPVGHFLPEDSTCLTWLDQQPVNSVIYVAFGSIAVLNQEQFNELAHGLELTGRPVLWVVRPGLTDGSMNTYPDGLREKGKIVNWAPQQKVLAHPSIACFVTHCGWNSIMDTLGFGVPFLCWPYFADQFHNKTYICNIWKIGLNLDRGGNGIISRDEIKSKVEELIGDEGIRTRIEEIKTMKKLHALVIPFPAQGHVIPLMEFSHCLSERGFKITFVNTEFNHKRVMASLPKNSCKENEIHLVSIPDGMEAGEDRNNLGKLCDTILISMPGYLEGLIGEINGYNDGKITCIIADENMGWAVRVAKKMGIPIAVFWPAAVGLRTLILHIPQLIEEGILDSDGIPIKQQMIQLSPTMPAMNTDHFVWSCIGDRNVQLSIFRYIFSNSEAIKDADWCLCNSFYEVELSAYPLNPKLLPVGPLLAGSQPGQLTGSFWTEDSTCLNWLDQQPARSVIYVAFGSFTVFDKHQFHELALGLENAGQPFLWVVRPDLTDRIRDAYPDGFQARVASQGRMVGWAPQQKVLADPSIACFVTHCGWNSTMEGITMGVPFLCWPYFADQFFNQNYICGVWNVGLQLNKDDNGIISKGEIMNKVQAILLDETIRKRALELKEIAKKSASEGGSSIKNLNDFIESVKEK
ncbi:UDP-glucuronosyl/UDP-glucosyltransferase [Macleaya cordata]|uniref:UDP-glucuronosyl/UDP-glucosyltransferase n=1 Tax=Macleaya cordata TaxID=56857 RepID=A0A200PRF6_MACCD|nr:UDP-glucuronosyl/UDP-glucosyltransferase [Macleaya cordata]